MGGCSQQGDWVFAATQSGGLELGRVGWGGSGKERFEVQNGEKKKETGQITREVDWRGSVLCCYQSEEGNEAERECKGVEYKEWHVCALIRDNTKGNVKKS